MLDLFIHDDKQLTIKYFDMDDGRWVNKKQNFDMSCVIKSSGAFISSSNLSTLWTENDAAIIIETILIY